MIFDEVICIYNYIELLPHKADVKAAIEWLNTEIPAIGRKDFSSDVYVNISEYEPKAIENGLFETHEEYIDIQMLLKGSERFFISFEGLLKETTAYNSETDCRFLEGTPAAELLLTPDNFVIAFEKEPHMPSIAPINNKSKVCKAVIKVKKQ